MEAKRLKDWVIKIVRLAHNNNSIITVMVWLVNNNNNNQHLSYGTELT